MVVLLYIRKVPNFYPKPRCTDRCPGASNLGLLEYRSILYPCINQLVIVCVEIFAQKECYIDDAANILVLITAIY